jgi:flagellar assembly factor FliW
MKLDINEITHLYITKIVIFSIFLFKNDVKNYELYTNNIFKFLKKRLSYKINLKIENQIKLDIEDERDVLIDVLLNDSKIDYLNIVTVNFDTPIRNVTLKINLNDEIYYEKLLYS